MSLTFILPPLPTIQSRVAVALSMPSHSILYKRSVLSLVFHSLNASLSPLLESGREATFLDKWREASRGHHGSCGVTYQLAKRVVSSIYMKKSSLLSRCDSLH
mmetsp:Transcript_48825/g.73778  ORF Transcript_48825/g.73778 Transcript_48825/m.73778 type:complete len:103 (-) Transcript_48825:1726-2034(-)